MFGVFVKRGSWGVTVEVAILCSVFFADLPSVLCKPIVVEERQYDIGLKLKALSRDGDLCGMNVNQSASNASVITLQI